MPQSRSTAPGTDCGSAWRRSRPMLQTKRKLKTPGHITGIVLTRPAKPFSQVSANCSDAVLPNAIYGGGKVVPITGGDFRNDGVQALLRLNQIGGPHRKKSVCPEASEQVELNLMDEGAALQRIQFVDRLRHLARSKTMDRLKEEPVRALRVVLKRRWRKATKAQLRASP